MIPVDEASTAASRHPGIVVKVWIHRLPCLDSNQLLQSEKSFGQFDAHKSH